MSEEKTQVPFKAKGSANQPKRQTYHASRGSRIKDLTEMFKWIKDKDKTTPEEKSALAYFTLRYEVSSENSQ